MGVDRINFAIINHSISFFVLWQSGCFLLQPPHWWLCITCLSIIIDLIFLCYPFNISLFLCQPRRTAVVMQSIFFYLDAIAAMHSGPTSTISRRAGPCTLGDVCLQVGCESFKVEQLVASRRILRLNEPWIKLLSVTRELGRHSRHLKLVIL